MDLTRVLRTATFDLTHTFYGSNGETPEDSTTTVTVAITDANGTAVTSGTATAVGGGTGTYRFTLPGQPLLALLTVAWSATIAGAAVVETDQAEIVGGHFFTLAEARASDSSLADTTRYPTVDLVEKRVEVEQECEEICDRAFVPRYRRALLDGSGTDELLLPDRDIRTIRSAKVSPRAGLAFVALSASELAALVARDNKVLRRSDGLTWTAGEANVLIEYEYGASVPPRDLRLASMIRLRSRLNLTRTQIPDRAVSFTSTAGGTYRLSTPAAYRTGIPEVDAAYARYSRRPSDESSDGGGGQGAPASRPLNYDPQRYSLFHGGVT